MAAYRRVDDLWSPAGDCLYTGISSEPNARYRVWEAFTFTFLLHRTRAVGVSQTLRRGTRNGTTEVSHLVIFTEGVTYIPTAAIRLGISPHFSYGRPNSMSHSILQLWFLSSSFSFFSSHILSGRRLDDYHTSTHDVALVRI